ncbi:MAG TPA: sigma-70 family RNA polymerase sigma factor [Phycisphaerae bacterium]|jgi:RNA polymerase sigma-70 factor (ECF subfamily)
MSQGGTDHELRRPKKQCGPADVAVAANRRAEEAGWVRKIQAGDLAPFGELVRRYQDQVYNTCWRVCGNIEDARDLTQDAFIKALDSIQDFAGKSAFYTWLFRIAVNLAISHRRRARHRQAVSLDGHAGGTDTDQAQRLSERLQDLRQVAPDQAGEQRELQRLVVQALQRLEDDFRTIIVLRDIEGLDYDEIATILDVPRGTVKSRLHRARLALRAAMAPLTSMPPAPGQFAGGPH